MLGWRLCGEHHAPLIVQSGRRQGNRRLRDTRALSRLEGRWKKEESGIILNAGHLTFRVQGSDGVRHVVTRAARFPAGVESGPRDIRRITPKCILCSSSSGLRVRKRANPVEEETREDCGGLSRVLSFRWLWRISWKKLTAGDTLEKLSRKGGARIDLLRSLIIKC